jgi:NitT/TauT family transport system substrate-binding protein
MQLSVLKTGSGPQFDGPAGQPVITGAVRNLRRVLLAVGLVCAHGAFAAESVRMMMNWKPEGSNAPFYMALDRGYFSKEGIEVKMDSGTGSTSAINAIASGAYQAGFGDFNAMVRYNAAFSDNRQIAVMMLYNRAPFSIIMMADSPVKTLKDLEGRKMLVPQNDAAYQMLPALAAANNIDLSKITFEKVAPNLRDALLVKRTADAATGYDSTSWFAMKNMGVKQSEVRYLNYADYGVDLYANAFLVSAKLAKESPATVTGLVRAINRAWIEAIRDPQMALDSLMKYEPTLIRSAELEKLQWVIKNQIVTPHTTANGLGVVDMARVEKSIDTLTTVFKLPTRVKAEDMVTSRFLPPAAERKLP